MHTISHPTPVLNRRAALAGGMAGLSSACASTPGPDAPGLHIAADLATYAGFGAKNAGGDGDGACGAWTEERLSRLGYRTERQAVAALEMDVRQSALVLDGRALELAVHDLGAREGPLRVQGPLLSWTPGAGNLDRANGAIVVAHLASRRWSSAAHPAIRDAISRAFAAGASAVVLATHGPSGELIHLNRRLANEAGPILLLAPRAWSEFGGAAHVGREALLAIDARQSAREAFNLVGRLDRGAPRWIVVSTPRSGWGVCAGERGPGVAAFLALAAWARERFVRHNLVFVCTSSHEFESAGAAAFIQAGAPPPETTALWLHLGAGFAARDWHEAGQRLLPLPSADPQRFLIASPEFAERARAAFAGLPGLEAAYPADEGAAGELGTVLAAGYGAAIGMFGAHRFHHTALDDMGCVEASHTGDVVARTQRLLDAAIAR